MYRGKRLLDLILTVPAMVALAPVLALAAMEVWLVDGAPVFYRARRAGLGGHVFTMYKLRSMRNRPRLSPGGVVTAANDARVYRLGAFLRRTKIDELPQLFNILRGEMSIIGPRPEDPAIVERYYDHTAREVLQARPGLASPGSLYDYTHGAQLMKDAADVEACYLDRVLPEMLALDWVYVQQATVGYDLTLIARTVLTILQVLMGRRRFPDPIEMPLARPVATNWRSIWLVSGRTVCDSVGNRSGEDRKT